MTNSNNTGDPKPTVLSDMIKQGLLPTTSGGAGSGIAPGYPWHRDVVMYGGSPPMIEPDPKPWVPDPTIPWIPGVVPEVSTNVLSTCETCSRLYRDSVCPFCLRTRLKNIETQLETILSMLRATQTETSTTITVDVPDRKKSKHKKTASRKATRKKKS